MRTRSQVVVGILIICLNAAFAAAQNVSFAGTQTTVNTGSYTLSYPQGVAVDAAGNLFIADSDNLRVVEVPAGGGAPTTVPTSGLLYTPSVAVDGAGDVFIADFGNDRVVEVPAGGGTQVTVPVSGLSQPFGLAVDGAGDLFIADWSNSRVAEVPAGGGPQTTVPASGLSLPYGVAVDGAGDVFIADAENNRVVEVPAGGGPQTTVGGGLYYPIGVAMDGAGNVFIADTENNRVVEVPAGGGPQTTVLTNGLYDPFAVAVDGAGNVFIADTENSRVVEVQRVAVNFGNVNVCPAGQTTPAPCNQTITLNYNVAAATTFGTINVLTQGTPNLDFTLSTGSTCTGTVSAGSVCTVNVTFAPLAPGVRMGAVQLSDNLGNLLVTTMVHGVGQGPAVAFGPGAQTTVGGGLSFPFGVAVDRAGDVFIADAFNNRVVEVPAGGGAQTAVGSGLSQPLGVAVDGAGDVFIADTLNSRVVEVPAGGGLQTTLGSGLSSPYGVAVDGAGDVFIGDTFNNRVVEVPAGGGPQTTVGSELNNPFGVAVDGAGDVFIVDTYNNRVVEVPAGGGPETTVDAVFSPRAVAVDGAGNVFIGDPYNNQVVEVQRAQPPSLTFASTAVGGASSDGPQSITIQNIGNQALNAITPGLVVTGPNFLQVASPGTPADCTSNFSLAPGETCNLSISFEPQSVGSLTAAATFTDSSLNATSATQSVTLRGIGTQEGQTIAFAALSNQALGSSPFTLSATASSGLAVSFGSTTPTVCTLSGATVTLATVGTCTVQATQSGNANYAAATPVQQSFQISDFTLTSNPTSATVTAGQPGTFGLTVRPQGSFTSAISLSCSGLPALAGCTFTSVTLTPNTGTVTTTLNITTTAHTMALATPQPGHRPSPLYAIWLVLPAMLLGTVGMTVPKGRKLLSCGLAFLLVSGCLLQVACGNGSPGVNSTTGTPAGTYSVVVMGTAGSTQNTTTIMLTVH